MSNIDKNGGFKMNLQKINDAWDSVAPMQFFWVFVVLPLQALALHLASVGLMGTLLTLFGTALPILWMSCRTRSST
jgi:hypothetical protein